jgi:putative membrane protein
VIGAPCDHGAVPRSLLVGAARFGTSVALGVAALAWPVSALAHGVVPAEPPSLSNLLLDWHLEPTVAVPLLLAAVGWLALVRRVRRVHPEHPVATSRSVYFVGGLAAIAVALMSGIEGYDTTLFWVHMIQHLLLVLVAAPLIALAAPITQLLRAAPRDVRNRVLLPVLHSTVVSALSHPVVAWLAFALVLWGSHFSPLFNAALEDRTAHDVEHGLYLVSALLFWWPVIGLDPSPRRMGYPARALYLLLQLPLNSFLGMAILFAQTPLYQHYATLGAPYGISAIADQQTAGGIMWLSGDIVFIVALLVLIAAWMRHEQREEPAADRRADLERARLGERADQLARTRAVAAGAAANQAGSGDSSSSR